MLYITKFGVFSFFMLLNSGSIVHHLEANKQSRLVERNVCFISDAGNCGGRVPEICPRLTPAPDKQGVRVFTDRIFFFFWRGGYMQKQYKHL